MRIKSINSCSENDLWDYIPRDYLVFKGQLFIDFIRINMQAVDEPFLFQTENKLIELNAERKLIAFQNLQLKKLLKPAGLIFHSARCGSTLLCNMLQSTEKCLVIRESGLINKIFADTLIDEDCRKWLYQLVVHFYCLYALKEKKACIIKFTSHSSLNISWFHKPYAKVPWVYLLRKPEDVIHSLTSKPAGWCSNKVLKKSFRLKHEILPYNKLKQIELLLTHQYQMIIDYFQQFKGLIAEYEKLVLSDLEAFNQITRWFNVKPNDDNKRILQCLSFNAKTGEKMCLYPIDVNNQKDNSENQKERALCYEYYQKVCCL
ncbi:hypothetical protein [Aliikangiella maris]|uniref:Sulfotransferase family protein n=2 Tax=Aliikangiella maris TaxID=3162458 RepID=A0ABV3MN82_9GAMM